MCASRALKSIAAAGLKRGGLGAFVHEAESEGNKLDAKYHGDARRGGHRHSLQLSHVIHVAKVSVQQVN